MICAVVSISYRAMGLPREVRAPVAPRREIQILAENRTGAGARDDKGLHSACSISMRGETRHQVDGCAPYGKEVGARTEEQPGAVVDFRASSRASHLSSAELRRR